MSEEPAWATDPRGLPPALLDDNGDLWRLDLVGYFWDGITCTPDEVERQFGPVTPLWPDPAPQPETVWRRCNGGEVLVRLLERAREAGVEVVAVAEDEEDGQRFSTTGEPQFLDAGRGYWYLRELRVLAIGRTPIRNIISVTAPLPPEAGPDTVEA